MNQNHLPFDEVRSYHLPDQQHPSSQQENHRQYLPNNEEYQSDSYNHMHNEQPVPEQDNRQFPFPGSQGGPFQGFPGGRPPGIGFPGQPSNQFPGGQGGQGFPGHHGNQPPGQTPPFGGGGQSAGPPNSPPPSFTPAEQQIQPFAVDPGAIRGCLFRFTYVWLNRDQFWFFPTFVGRNSVAGFRWRRNRWVYFGIDLNRIQSFQCY